MRMPRPNVLWIFFDELRADALGCYGHPRVAMRTPAIDSLAAGGTVFEECYTNSPVCVPSRTSMLTGLHPEQTGVYHNEAYAPGYPVAPRPDTVTEALAREGYRTASFGKEHVPRAIDPWQLHEPLGSGMREPLAGFADGELDLLRTAGQGMVVAGAYPDDRRYPAAAVTSRAIAWLEQAPRGEPFLLRVSYLQPHTPVVAPAAYATLYPPDGFGAPRDERGGLSAFERRFAELGGGRDMPVSDVERAAACYYGLVAWLDTQVADLLAAVRRLGLDETTAVVLGADHGAYLGEEGAFAKHTFARQVQRVPFIVHDPRRPGGVRRGDLAQLLDFGRTLCGVAGVEVPGGFGGRDLFRDAAPDAVFSTIGYGAERSRAFPNRDAGTYVGGRGWPRRACVRTDRYRLDMNVRLDGRAPRTEDEEDVFLADRSCDPQEIENRAQDPAFADVVATLRGRLADHVRGAVETPDGAVYGCFDAELRRLRAARQEGNI